ncbi:MAG: transporter [Planctomycetes bacterium]|nr:transporter [Planctomycetota bacterium]
MFPDIRLRNEVDPADTFEQEFDGIGDTSLTLRYAFPIGETAPHEETGEVHAHAPVFSFNAGLSFPTGEPEEPTITGPPGSPIANSTLQTGTGTFDPLLGVSYVQAWGPFSIFGSVALRIPGGENRFDYRTGAAALLSLGATVPLDPKFVAAPKVSVAWTEPDELDGDDVFASGGTWLNLVPGFLLRLSENADLQAAVEIPVWRNLRTEQLDTQARFAVGVSYRF